MRVASLDSLRGLLRPTLQTALGSEAMATEQAGHLPLNTRRCFDRSHNKQNWPEDKQMMDHMMDGMMGLGWLWMVLGAVLLAALILLVVMLIVRASRGPRP